jgi:hypothetical protein
MQTVADWVVHHQEFQIGALGLWHEGHPTTAAVPSWQFRPIRILYKAINFLGHP